MKIWTARFHVVQVDAKREIEKIVHRPQAVELKAVLGLLLDLFAAEVLRIDLHRLRRQQSRLTTVSGQFVGLVRLVVWIWGERKQVV